MPGFLFLGERKDLVDLICSVNYSNFYLLIMVNCIDQGKVGALGPCGSAAAKFGAPPPLAAKDSEPLATPGTLESENLALLWL